jgi:hypothetical protein
MYRAICSRYLAGTFSYSAFAIASRISAGREANHAGAEDPFAPPSPVASSGATSLRSLGSRGPWAPVGCWFAWVFWVFSCSSRRFVASRGSPDRGRGSPFSSGEPWGEQLPQVGIIFTSSSSSRGIPEALRP